MKLGILPGTFSPIHNGHIILAFYAMDELKLDKVLFVPNTNPKHKNCTVSPIHRYNMVKLALLKYKDTFIYEDVNLQRVEVSEFIDTMVDLRLKYPDDRLYIILGNDYKKDRLMGWREKRIISKMGKIVVAEKDFYAPRISIRSTLIRYLINNGKPLKLLVPELVVEYIKQHNLYDWLYATNYSI